MIQVSAPWPRRRRELVRPSRCSRPGYSAIRNGRAGHRAIRRCRTFGLSIGFSQSRECLLFVSAWTQFAGDAAYRVIEGQPLHGRGEMMLAGRPPNRCTSGGDVMACRADLPHHRIYETGVAYEEGAA